MADAVSTVERLRLRAPSEATVRRAVIRLEDALRTASLPDRGPRVVVVRRLALGRIAASASTQSLALTVEARLASLGGGLVHAKEPGAADADAVWFRDALEAHTLAALRVAAGSPLDAWYWRLAVPVLKRSGTTRAVLRALAFSLAGFDEAPAALPHFTATLVLAGHADRFVAALRPGDGAALLRSAGVDRDHAALVDATGARALRDVVAAETARALDAADHDVGERPPGDHHEREDDRHVFVRSMLRRAAAQAIASRDLRRLAVRAGRIVSSLVGTTAQVDATEQRAERQARDRERWVQPALDAGDALRDLGVLTEVDRHVTLRSRSTVGPEASAACTTRRDESEARSPEASRAAGIDSGPAARIDRQSRPGQPTGAGGLLFLVPLLQRLGFERWWSARVESGSEHESIAAIILGRVLERLHVPSDDPMWALASPEPWSVDAHAWLSACRRVLRRPMRIGLGALVLRPARLALTPTHADVFFALDAADVRVRRAGLDIDPGWVLWFGRVLAFHYGSEQWT